MLAGSVSLWDEPFSGLDPINTRVVSTLIKELSASGKTVLLSTHQMGLVESMCRRVFMINRGWRVFYGDLDAIKKRYSDDTILVKSNIFHFSLGPRFFYTSLPQSIFADIQARLNFFRI